MAGFLCSFCNQIMTVNYTTKSTIPVHFVNDGRARNYLNVVMHLCPNCGEMTIFACESDAFEGTVMINPQSHFKIYPDYVPVAIRKDYEEACSIIDLSPKASATLARRCLQGMIRDFWGIVKGSLFEEINELQSHVPAQQWLAIDALRKIGNIGAHMEKDINIIVDVDPDEAHKLIRLIEVLIDKWYIARNDEAALFSELTSMADNKKNPPA